jgi:hypothetical protein
MAGKGQTQLQVIDALDHPHGGRILRLRVREGNPPAMKDLKGRTLKASGPGGEEASVRVTGFPVFGGKVSDARIRDTGRVDVVVEGGEGGASAIDLTWTVVLS